MGTVEVEMYNFGKPGWIFTQEIISRSFVCWNCNNSVASNKGYGNHEESPVAKTYNKIYICPHCNAPNVFDLNNKAILSSLPGKEIKKLPENIKNIYKEVRKCMQSACFTGAIMLMRKIIMNIAVQEKAKENKSFVDYVKYLCDEGIVPKKSKEKADSIRRLGNNANHEIENRTQEEAQNCFEFIELLLMANYEFADEKRKDGN